jgi:hypothetical protein
MTAWPTDRRDGVLLWYYPWLCLADALARLFEALVSILTYSSSGEVCDCPMYPQTR